MKLHTCPACSASPRPIAIVLLVALGCLAARPAAAQSCSEPSFIAPPAAPNLVATTVVQPHRVAAGDLNGDGLLDFVVGDLQNPNIQVFVQQPFPPGGYVGGVTIATGGIPTAVRVADVNRDGKLDILVARKGSAQGLVFLGDGAGGTSGPTVLLTAAGSVDTSDIVSLDIDRDGILDVVIADVTFTPPANRGLYAFKGNGDGTFQTPVRFGTTIYGSLALTDLDRDGKLDIAAATGINPAAIETFTGTSTFSPPFISVFGIGVGPNPLPAYNTVTAGDFDHDGRSDVAIADSNQVRIFQGLGNGQLSGAGSFPLPSGALSLQAGDVNLDGDLDLAFITPAPTGLVGVILGDGGGGFRPPGLSTFDPSADGVAVALGDFDGDGRTDLAAANLVGRRVAILLNNFQGICSAASFGPAARTFSYWDPRSLATGDFNGDGRRDVVSASTSANQVSVLLASSGLAFPTAPSVAPGFGGQLNVGGFSSPRFVAVADFTSDAVQDLAVANGGSTTVSILRGNGAGGFIPLGTVSVGTTPVAIGIGDFNDDNRRDLAVVNQSSNTVSIRLGNGDGTFGNASDVGVGPSPVAVAVADFNLDNRPDLAVVNSGSNDVSIRLGAGAGGFTGTASVAVGSNPVSLGVGDFNLDGRPDLVVANQGSGNLSVLTGNGDGTFTAASPLLTGASPTAVVVTKLNGDTQPDLAVTLPGISSVRAFLGSGPATFDGGTDYFVGAAPQSLAEGDVTEDGRPDILVGVGGSSNYLAVVTSLGTGALATAPSYSQAAPGAVATSDFDRDGDLDLVFGSDAGNLAFHRNAGDGTFSPISTVATSPQPRVLAVADFDRDGRDDLAVGFLTNPVKTFQGNGSGSFALFTPPMPSIVAAGLAVADFDRDGQADLVLAERFTNRAHILVGDGFGGFAPTPLSFDVLSNAVAVAVGDFDGNGLTDFVVSHDPSNQLAVLLNVYDFTPPIQISDFARVMPDPVVGFFGALHLAAGDFNGDAKLDLVTADVSGQIKILFGDGTGQFPSSAFGTMDGSVSALVAVDVNHDGNLDVVATSDSLQSVSMHMGNGGTSGLARPVYYTPSNPFGSSSAVPAAVAIGDYDGDGKLDLAVANLGSNSFSIYRNTNCTSRRLAMVTEVSACNTPNVPFVTQPSVGVLDDGGNPNQCEAGLVTASIAPGTGTGGAVLVGPPLAIPPASGVASYTNLKIDVEGRRYRLAFGHSAGSALSRSFSQGLTVAISGGPLDLCIGQPASFDAGPGYDSYAWTLDAPPPFSFASNVTLSTLGVGLHNLQVSVQQDGCNASDAESPNVNADLSTVTISTPGPTTVCTTCVGGTVDEMHSGGGAILGRQWQFATVSGGPYVNIPDQTGATYAINGANFPGPGDYFLVLRTNPSCGAPLISNEVMVRVVAALPSEVVTFFTVTSADGRNTLEWVNAPGRSTVRIRFNAGPSSCPFPSAPDGSDGSIFLADQTGPVGGRDARLHTGGGVLNDTKYCYTIWTNLGGPFGPGRSNGGRPFSTAGRVQWAFNIGTAALVAPGNGIGVMYSVAMDNSLHSMIKGVGGGTWPTSPFVWMPQEMNGPSQGRPAGIPFSAGGATRLIFLGDEAGFVHAFNAETGSQVWVTGSPIGDKVVGGPSGIFKVFGGFDDQVLIGTYNAATGNVFYALDPANGNVLWSYNGNDGVVDHGRIGIISGQAAVDYEGKRAYFASRAFGGAPDNKTVWCVRLTDGKACWAQPYGDLDGGITLLGDRLFAGTNTGKVIAVRTSDGGDAWSGVPLTTNDGNVRGYVAPDRLTGDLYFSTSSKVWRVRGMGASPAELWSVPFTNPSTPVYAPGDSIVYVGGDGRLFELSVSNASVIDSILLGDGSARVGSPTLDVRNGFAYVGTVAGIVYATRIP